MPETGFFHSTRLPKVVGDFIDKVKTLPDLSDYDGERMGILLTKKLDKAVKDSAFYGSEAKNDPSASNLTQKSVNKAVQDVRQRFYEED